MPGNDVMQYFEPVVLPVSRLWAIVANQNSPDSARAKSTCALGGSTAVPRAGWSRFLSFCFSLFFLFLFYFSRFCCPAVVPAFASQGGLSATTGMSYTNIKRRDLARDFGLPGGKNANWWGGQSMQRNRRNVHTRSRCGISCIRTKTRARQSCVDH